MIFDILLVLIVIEFVKVLAEDGYSTVTGRPNPRIDRRRARQRSRRDNRIWGALVNYLGDVAEDARERAAEKRQEQRENRRRDPEPRVIASPPGRLAERPEPGELDELEDQGDPPRGFWDLGPRPCALCDEPGEMVQRPDGRAFIHDRTGDRCPAIEPDPRPEPTPAGDEGTDARVIPLFPTTQEDPMTATTGEATGLVSAMNHAEALRKTYENYAAMGDTFVASLANGEVSGEAVNAAQRAREAEQLAAAEWAACHTALAEQLAVKEAYNATPDAGSKQFVTSE